MISIIYFVFSFCFVGDSRSQPLRILSFQEASEIALRDNTDILAIRSTEESAKHHESQALSPNSPQFSFSNNNASTPFRLSQGSSKTYQIIWTLGFPGKAILASKQYNQNALSAREQGLEKEVSILSSLGNLYIAIAADTQLVKILQQEVQRTGEVTGIIQHKYALGQASQVDLLSARSAVAKLNHELLNAEETGKVLQTQFLNILRKPEANYEADSNTSIEVPQMVGSLEGLIQIMLHNRHLLRSSEFQVGSADTAALVAGLQWLPDVQLTAGMNLYGIPSAQPNPSLSRDYTFGFQITIPVFFPLNELNGYKAARADRASAEYLADSIRLQAISDLKSGYTLYNSGFRQLKNIQEFLLPATKAAYDLTIKSYGMGKADYLRLSDARNNWVETQKDELGKRSELAQLFNNITLTVGCDFLRKEGPHVCK